MARRLVEPPRSLTASTAVSVKEVREALVSDSFAAVLVHSSLDVQAVAEVLEGRKDVPLLIVTGVEPGFEEIELPPTVDAIVDGSGTAEEFVDQVRAVIEDRLEPSRTDGGASSGHAG